MPVSKAWIAYQKFRKLSRAFQEPDLSKTYDSNTTMGLRLSCQRSSAPNPCKQAIDLPSGQLCKIAATIKGVASATNAWDCQPPPRCFSACHCNWEPNESQRLRGRIGSGRDDPRESTDRFFQGSRAAVQWTSDLRLAQDCKYGAGFQWKTHVRLMSESGIPAMTKTPRQIDAPKGGG